MALLPSSDSRYNGQAASFTCPYVADAVQWEWWSDNASAASVSANGQSATVTFHNWTSSDIGSITLYCNAKNEFNQTVAQHQAALTARTCPATGMSVSPSAISLTYDNQYGYMTGTLTTNQGDGAQVSLTGVNYASANTAICAVGSSGLLNAEGNGTVNVWVGANNYSGIAGFCTVTVTGFPPPNVPVTGVSVSPTSVQISPGGQTTLTATVVPSNATNKGVSWSTSNPGIAQVSGGVVTGIGAGTCTVTVTTNDGGFQASCTVTVGTPRPSNWSWSYSMSQYGTVRNTVVSATEITAYIVTPEEWNSYTARVNAFRAYKGLSAYGFTSVVYNTIFTPAIYNEVVSAMAPMASGLSTAYAGGITAAQINALRDVLNSIT